MQKVYRNIEDHGMLECNVICVVLHCDWWQVELKLEKVSLLFENSRHHFYLSHPQLSAQCQLADGATFITKSSRCGKTTSTKYNVEVHFTGGMFGLFRQWLIFDFGDRPVLILTVELGQAECRSRVRSLREKLEFDRYLLYLASFDMFIVGR